MRLSPGCLLPLLVLLLWVGAARAQAPGSPQDLPQLQEQLLRYRPVPLKRIAAEAPPLRCATPLVHLGRQHRDDLSSAARGALDEYATSLADLGLRYPTLEGHFDIVYDTEGLHTVPLADDDLNGVPDYVEWVGEAMEESWTREVVELGYLPPVLGGDRFEVWLLDIGATYGYTEEDAAAPGGQRIVLHADFPTFYSLYNLPNDDPDGLVRGGIRVTAAHEFKHVCQWNESEWSEIDFGTAGLLEVDAVWMEDIAYDQVNDYYNYLDQSDSPFAHPENSLILASYGGSNWQHYLSERYGLELVRAWFERRGDFAFAEAPQFSYRTTLEDAGIDWEQAWAEYMSWVYLSGSRAQAGEGFEEDARYPTARVQTVESTLPATGGGSSDRLLRPLTGHFHRFLNPSSLGGTPRVVFSGSPVVPWALRVVLERADGVSFVELPVSATGQADWTGAGLDLADYEGVALVVGCTHVVPASQAGAASQAYAYELSLDVTETTISGLLFAAPAPNPFRNGTTLSFAIPRSGPTSIVLYDLRGRRVKTVYEGRPAAGILQPVVLDDRLPDGGDLAAGVYLLRLMSPAGEKVRRVVHVR